MPPRRLKVLVVDDSAVVRQTLTAILEQEPEIGVTVAADPLIAHHKIARERPDVIVLDLEMPRMNGLTFLRALMARDSIPVVVCSALTGGGAAHAIRAMEEGAVSIVSKPSIAVREFLYESALQLIDAVRAAAASRPRPPALAPTAAPKLNADVILPRPRRTRVQGGAEAMIAIGASAGGTEALRVLLQAFPEDCPGTVIVQHMPESFTAAFAARLDTLCAARVSEAVDGDVVEIGRVLVAPGNRHLMLRRRGANYTVALSDGPLVSRHRPSVDVLFRSVASSAGARAVGVIMTGMGDDGADGLLEMRQAGARTFAQDEASSVVFGMPKEAIARGAVERILPLDSLGTEALLAAKISLTSSR